MENTCVGGQKSARTLLSHPLSICSVGVTNLHPCAVPEKKSEDTKGEGGEGVIQRIISGTRLNYCSKETIEFYSSLTLSEAQVSDTLADSWRNSIEFSNIVKSNQFFYWVWFYWRIFSQWNAHNKWSLNEAGSVV